MHIKQIFFSFLLHPRESTKHSRGLFSFLIFQKPQKTQKLGIRQKKKQSRNLKTDKKWGKMVSADTKVEILWQIVW